MWAMMPMLRVFSSEYCRSTSVLSFLLRTCEEGGRCCAPLYRGTPLPAVMCEGLVGLRHLVRVLSLLYRHAAIVRGIEHLGRQLVGHAALGPAPGGHDHPAHRQRRPAVGAHL